ncbi:hypothetical protein CAPTEDRAFT_219569 [Capitella teleta]|uniref:SRCR domain-containing protein n=1 Tax=Capitella teleta TaxID=283909 RepID=R7ULG9_CAPTE|nr:hypothetical protein CAPTEDRAFT_219569 [Capitella teleta]|eukprot:ELU04112.1 hypothetical protein CAPTEDRAFT_219569 [Capitella teleta]
MEFLLVLLVALAFEGGHADRPTSKNEDMAALLQKIDEIGANVEVIKAAVVSGDDEEEFTGSPLMIGNAHLGISGNGTRGRLEVFYGEEWGTVCDDDFTDAFAAIICKYLGLPYANAVEIHNFGGGTGKPIHLDQVDCERAPDARYCKHRGWGVHNCDHSEDLGIECK